MKQKSCVYIFEGHESYCLLYSTTKIHLASHFIFSPVMQLFRHGATATTAENRVNLGIFYLFIYFLGIWLIWKCFLKKLYFVSVLCLERYENTGKELTITWYGECQWESRQKLDQVVATLCQNSQTYLWRAEAFDRGITNFKIIEKILF